MAPETIRFVFNLTEHPPFFRHMCIQVKFNSLTLGGSINVEMSSGFKLGLMGRFDPNNAVCSGFRGRGLLILRGTLGVPVHNPG